LVNIKNLGGFMKKVTIFIRYVTQVSPNKSIMTYDILLCNCCVCSCQ